MVNGKSFLAACLSAMYMLTSAYYGNQVSFFESLWSSYYERDPSMVTVISQSRVSKFLRGIERIPRRMYRFYIAEDDCGRLRNAISQHLDEVVATHRELVDYADAIASIVRSHRSLYPQDREHILSSIDGSDPNRAQLEEMLYRTLRVAWREEFGIRRV